ncbi:MAG: ECF transporter S component [Desulfurococcaceae archaeon]
MQKYRAVDLALLGVASIISGLIFAATWFVYEVSLAIGGIYLSRLISYGLWFIGAPLTASLIRKPLSGFLGEFLGALVETLIPTIGGFTNLIYGFAQGLASEAAYAIFKYKKYGALQAALAGVFAAPPCVALDAILFREIYPYPVMLILLIAAATSGAIYGLVSYYAVKSIKGE